MSNYYDTHCMICGSTGCWGFCSDDDDWWFDNYYDNYNSYVPDDSETTIEDDAFWYEHFENRKDRRNWVELVNDDKPLQQCDKCEYLYCKGECVFYDKRYDTHYESDDDTELPPIITPIPEHYESYKFRNKEPQRSKKLWRKLDRRREQLCRTDASHRRDYRKLQSVHDQQRTQLENERDEYRKVAETRVPEIKSLRDRIEQLEKELKVQRESYASLLRDYRKENEERWMLQAREEWRRRTCRRDSGNYNPNNCIVNHAFIV